MVWLIAVCVYGHCSRIAGIVPVFVIDYGRSFAGWNILLGVSIFLFEIVSLVNFLYYFLIFILDFLDFFLQVLKLLMQMRYLLSSSRVPLIINSSGRSQISFVAHSLRVTAFSKALTHLKIHYCYKGKILLTILWLIETLISFLIMQMLVGTIVGAIGIADIFYLIKTIKKYRKLHSLIKFLENS